MKVTVNDENVEGIMKINIYKFLTNIYTNYKHTNLTLHANLTNH